MEGRENPDVTPLAEEVEKQNPAVIKRQMERTREMVASVQRVLQELGLTSAQAVEKGKVQIVADRALLDAGRTERILNALEAEKDAQESERLETVVRDLQEALRVEEKRKEADALFEDGEGEEGEGDIERTDGIAA